MRKERFTTEAQRTQRNDQLKKGLSSVLSVCSVVISFPRHIGSDVYSGFSPNSLARSRWDSNWLRERAFLS